MELFELISTLKPYKKRIMVASTVFAIIGGLFAFYFPLRYTARVEVFVHQISREGAPTTFYDYEGYYSRLNSRDHTDTVTGLIKSKMLMQKTLKDLNRGDLPSTSRDSDNWSRKIKVRELGPSLIEVSLTSFSEDLSISILDAQINNTLSTVRELYLNRVNYDIEVTRLNDDAQIKLSTYSWWVGVLLGFGLGLSLSSGYFFIKEKF